MREGEGAVRRQADPRRHPREVGQVRDRGPQKDIGYIRISSFTEQTQEGLEAAIAQLKKETGDKLKGYIIDLRNNPGGLLDQAISVSDTFLDRGEVVSTRGRNADETQRFNAQRGRSCPTASRSSC